MQRGQMAALAAVALAMPAAVALAMPAAVAGASETVDYSYDALGRLVSASTAGGPNANRVTSTTFDPAGNRCGHRLSNSGTGSPAACPAGGGGGGGGGTNQPPAGVNDSGTMTRCAGKSFAVLANDSDPDGNLPLTIFSASYTGFRGTVDHDATYISFTPNGQTGSASVSYVVRDSLGATDPTPATLTINITDGDCGPQQLNAETQGEGSAVDEAGGEDEQPPAEEPAQDEAAAEEQPPAEAPSDPAPLPEPGAGEATADAPDGDGAPQAPDGGAPAPATPEADEGTSAAAEEEPGPETPGGAL